MPEASRENREQFVESVRELLEQHKRDAVTEKAVERNSGKATLYASLGIAAVLTFARFIVQTKFDIRDPAFIPLFYLLLLVPWVLLAVYIFDEYPPSASVSVPVPMLGKMPLPGGAFTIAAVTLVAAAFIGKIDYELFERAAGGDGSSDLTTVTDMLEENKTLLLERTSATLSVRFDEEWGDLEKSCEVHAVLLINKEELAGCEQRFGMEELSTYPEDRPIHRGEVDCPLADDLIALRASLDRKEALNDDAIALAKRYSGSRDIGVYHGLMIVRKTIDTVLPGSSKESLIRPSRESLDTVSRQPVHFVPIFTMNNRTLEEKHVQIYMDRIHQLHSICELNDGRRA